MTPLQLARACGCSMMTAATWLPHLVAAMERYEIDTLERKAAFLAQVAHESGHLTRLEENLNYSAQRLLAVWPSRFPTLELAARYAYSPEKLANFVYADRMGNGPSDSGEGWRFRGRGLLQTTGMQGYFKVGTLTGLPLVTMPDMLLEEGPAALSAGAVWEWKGCNALVDGGDFPATTRAINGGYNGAAERFALYTAALRHLA